MHSHSTDRNQQQETYNLIKSTTIFLQKASRQRTGFGADYSVRAQRRGSEISSNTGKENMSIRQCLVSYFAEVMDR